MKILKKEIKTFFYSWIPNHVTQSFSVVILMSSFICVFLLLRIRFSHLNMCFLLSPIWYSFLNFFFLFSLLFCFYSIFRIDRRSLLSTFFHINQHRTFIILNSFKIPFGFRNKSFNSLKYDTVKQHLHWARIVYFSLI